MKQLLTFLFLAVFAAGGCVTGGTVARDPAGGRAASTLVDIVVEDSGGKTTIDVTADGPLTYTVYKPSDPYQVVAELPGVSPGAFTDTINVSRGNVVDIVPLEVTEPTHMTRLQINLDSPIDVTSSGEDNVLVLSLGSSEGPARTETAATTQTAETDAEYVPPKIGTVIRDINVAAADGRTVVRIESNGVISGDVFSLSDDRIVVDVPNVTTDLQYVTASQAPLKSIRLGRHSDKVRIVLDLDRAVDFEVGEEGKALVVALRDTTRSGEIEPVVVAKTDASAVLLPSVGDTGGSGADMHGAEPARVSEQSGTAYQTTRTPRADALAGAETVQGRGQRASAAGDAGGTTPGKKIYTGQRISLDFQNADVVQVLRLIAEVRGLNLVVHPEVKGAIPSLLLKNVPADQAQEIILKLAGMEAEETDNILRVAPASVFAKEKESVERLRQASVKAESLEQKIYKIAYADAAEIKKAIKDAKILSKRGDITVDGRSNRLIVKDVPSRFDDVEELISIMDKPKRQVKIAARIVEMSLDSERRLGVNWFGTFIGNRGAGNVPTALGTQNALDTLAGSLSTNVSYTDDEDNFFDSEGKAFMNLMLGSVADTFSLGLQIDALENVGDAKTISNPKIITMDNEEAEITQGAQVPYQTVSQEGTKTEFKDASLTLTVTPTITPGDRILVKVKIDNDSVGQNTDSGPIINTSQVQTQAMVKNGETMVIGGVYKTTLSQDSNKIPLLGDIPGLGWLFKTKTDKEVTREIMIFLTPEISAVDVGDREAW